MEIISDIKQGTQEWLDLRLGKITASRLKDVMTKGRGGAPSKTRQSYMIELAAEILTGEQLNSFSNKAMDWGNECEPQARDAYEFEKNIDVDEVAFIKVSEWFGVSPDGLVGDDGMLEIKCPNTTTQISRYLSGVFAKDYHWQVQGQLLASGRKWCDFLSFDPRIDGAAQYFCIRVERDENAIAELEIEIEKFTNELKEILEQLK